MKHEFAIWIKIIAILIVQYDLKQFPRFTDNTWFRILGYVSMTEVIQWIAIMSTSLRDVVRRFNLDEARQYWYEVPEAAWQDADVLTYVHSGRALFPWRRGFFSEERGGLCTVDVSCASLVSTPHLTWRRVGGFDFEYKGHARLQWRPWPMVFLSPEQIIDNGLSFQDAGYRNATHWHRQVFGLLDRAHAVPEQEAAAFPPPVHIVFNRTL